MRFKLASVAAMAVLFSISSVFAGVMNPIPGDPVTIDSGKVSGTLLGSGIRAYYGIPFAAPPILGNRWRAPRPVKPWTGIYNADTKRAECVQALRSPSINNYFGDEYAGEDCLYLNIWAPASAKQGAKLPVIVWIYGGAFSVGSASMPLYSGEFLAKKGVIYVAINYRVGIFGFLAHPELTKESGHNASGNWGFLDQVAGLKWVQRNIASFGGDPANVTLLGQSAGSMSITDLQASPLAKGLFARVFGMSGTTLRAGGGTTLDGVPLAEAEAQGVQLQTAMKAKNLADMRSFSSDKVMAAAGLAGVQAKPSIDGYFLPRDVDSIFAAGQQSDVPVVTGSTANDLFTDVPIGKARTVAEYEDAANAMFGTKAEAFLKLFPVKTDADVKRQAANVARNSGGMPVGARAWVRAQTKTGKQPGYLYMVTKVQPFAPVVTFSDFTPTTAGAYHMSDVPYFLGTYEALNQFRTTRNWTKADRELSEKMQDSIIAYARSGNPATSEVKFVKWQPDNETRVVFGDTITVEKLNSKQMDFLAENPPARAPRAAGARGRGGPNPPQQRATPRSPTY